MTDDTRTLRQAVPPELAGQRLDQALARMFPEYSRSRLKRWIVNGLVTVDGDALRPRDPVASGQAVELAPQPEVAIATVPEPIELTVCYEDEDVLVINKPAGLVVHPGAGNTHGTLMNGLVHYLPHLAELPRAGIIHRLDKDTSGLLLVGKSLTAHTHLVRELALRNIARGYRAVCMGVLTGGGTIVAAIARHAVDRRRMCVREDGKPAVTHYRVLERFPAHTYISVQLETGRTHQIRVHFAWRRHPLLGDPVYGGRLALPAGATSELQAELKGFRRQALHAATLSFAQPGSGATVDVAADPPQDFAQLLAALRRSAEAGTS